MNQKTNSSPLVLDASSSHLRALSDADLIANTRALLAKERVIRTEVIRHLIEIERRRLYAERGYPSLFEFCIRELNLSNASAHRRIATARLLREIPEIESKITSGALSLSAATVVYSTARKLKRTHSPAALSKIKRELLTRFENTTTRDREEQLAEMFPRVSFAREYMRPVSPDHVEIKLTVSRALARKIERLMEVMAHQNREQTLEGLLARLVELGLKKSDPLYKSGS